jgi:DNA-binding CsgD family transcriptional regulator
VVRQIDRDIDTEAHWKIFETHLEQVHEDFLKHMTNQHNDLTAREMRLAAYLRMDMSSKEIASLMNITPRAIENNRYKLRKKIGLGQGDNLVDYIMKI